MKIYHYTPLTFVISRPGSSSNKDYENNHKHKFSIKDSILCEGLTFKYKDWSEREEKLNSLIMKLKPMHYPDFIDRSKCVFFTFDISDYEFGFETEADNLDTKKLFVFDYKVSCDLYDTAYFRLASETYREYKSRQKSLIKKYWDSMTPYNDFKSIDGDKSDKELLYFGEVPPGKLSVISDPTEVIECINSIIGSQYELNSKYFNSLGFYTSGNRDKTFYVRYLASKETIELASCDDLSNEIKQLVNSVATKVGLKYMTCKIGWG